MTARAYDKLRYGKLRPMGRDERLAHVAERVDNAIAQLRVALLSDPSSVRTYAHAVCSRHAEYEAARSQLAPSPMRINA